MFLPINFWVVNLILDSKNHLIEKKIDNSSNKMIVMWATVLKQGWSVSKYFIFPILCKINSS